MDTMGMTKEVNGKFKKKSPSFIHVNQRRGDSSEGNMSPVVPPKKRKLRKSGSSNDGILDEILPVFAEGDAREVEDATQQSLRQGISVPQRQEDGLSFIHTMTHEELEDHIQKCLEMSSENKITPKNAFALQLIDCMNILMQKEKDFSTMACTLDAGAKIYSYRVDALHRQVMKLADEVIKHRREKQKESQEVGEEDENDVDKKLRRSKKRTMIAASESLARKMKLKDPKDNFIKLEALPGAIMSRARRDPKDMSFSLEHSLPFWKNWEKYEPVRAEGVVTLPKLTILRCMARKSVESIDIGEPINESTMKPSTLNDDVVMVEDEHNHSPESTVNDAAGDSPDLSPEQQVDNGVTGEPSPCEEVEVISTAIKRLQEEQSVGTACREPSRFEAMKIIFNEDSDYHYLDMKNAHYWAGPEFWKRPKGKDYGSNKGKKNQRKKKEPRQISYDNPETLNKWSNKKMECGLSKQRVLNWKKKKFTLPQCLNIEVSLFLDLFHISTQNQEFLLDRSSSTQAQEESGEIVEDPDSQPHLDSTSSSQDPLNACFYEGVLGDSGSSEERDPLNNAFYDSGLARKAQDSRLPKSVIRVQVSPNDTPTFEEPDMVPIPKTVTFEPIKYSTRPIRVNMQNLKESMMDVIRKEMERDEVTTRRPETRFSDVLKNLPKRLERRTAQDLSEQIAFLALLMLANEHNLQLRSTDDFKDVIIRLEELRQP